MNEKQNIPEAGSEVPTDRSEIVNEKISPQSVTGNVQETEPPVSQSQTSDIQLPQENMEAHHHRHIHHQKKWKDYLFEFLMLFLAVFCGFLAEYQLEHVIEHNREKQYIKSFAEDLEADNVYMEQRLAYSIKK